MFDGVHLGHAALLDRAGQSGYPIVVYTFSTSPRGASFLTLPEDRERLLRACGADYVIFDSFSEIRTMSPEAFVRRIVCGALSAKHVVCGFNYRFGAKAAGDTEMLSALLGEAGVPLDVVGAVVRDSEPISSTRIRGLLLDGRLEEAEDLLGRAFFYRLPVTSGKQLGRKIGIPTANQRIPQSLLTLPRGVYASQVCIGGVTYAAVSNIGSRPTVNPNEADLNCETHILGFEGDLYGKDLTVQFLSYLREETKFSDLDALRTQIALDAERANRIACARRETTKGRDEQ